MPRFFCDVTDEDNIIIEGDDARHIGRSLRMKIGDDLTVTCKGTDYFCKILSISDSEVVLETVSKSSCKTEPSIYLKLYQAVPKLDKLETIIQKSVELGVSEIVPVLSRRCISRPSDKDFLKKLPRYQKIALEAAKQSGRGIIPKISPIISFKEAVLKMSADELPLILYENNGQRFSQELFPKELKTVSVMIGSEGGFDEQEVNLAIENGCVPIWLGERILRCETAPLAAASIIMFLTKNI